MFKSKSNETTSGPVVSLTTVSACWVMTVCGVANIKGSPAKSVMFSVGTVM